MEDKRLNLWNNLIDFTSRHKKFSDAKWSLDKEQIAKIDLVANKLKPKNSLNLYARLFNDRDSDFFRGVG